LGQKNGEIPTTNEKGEVLDFLPCRQTLHNYIDRLSGWEKRRIRENIDEANREHAPRGRKPKVALPFEEWQGDHALLPVQTKVSLRDKQGNVVEVGMGGVWFTGLIDVASQYVFPAVLGTDGPSTARSQEALRIAMCPKDAYFESVGLKGQYDPTIIPQMIFLDNQADNHGKDQDAMMADMDIENGYAGAYRGDHKESIERFNRKLKKWWRKFPGANPRPEENKRGKRPRKFPVVPLTIEQIRLETARFIAEYNDTPQKGLGNISPRQAMERGIAKIEAARKSGRPLPLRSIMTKSVDDIDRAFTIRATAVVRSNGVRHKYLEWTGSGFTDRIGHKVDIHMNPRDLQEVWIFDPTDKAWFKAYGAWPYYMQGLPWTEHLRIRARVLKHEAAQNKTGKRPTVDFKRRYMANRAEGLRRLFALAGKDFELDLGKKRNDKLWNGSRAAGHSLDFAILSTCAAAVDFRENRIPPGWEQIMGLKKERGALVPIAFAKPAKNAPYWEVDDEDDGEIDMMSDPLARNEENATA
jgi:putative transposase